MTLRGTTVYLAPEYISAGKFPEASDVRPFSTSLFSNSFPNNEARLPFQRRFLLMVRQFMNRWLVFALSQKLFPGGVHTKELTLGRWA